MSQRLALIPAMASFTIRANNPAAGVFWLKMRTAVTLAVIAEISYPITPKKRTVVGTLGRQTVKSWPYIRR